jgi:predicted membrane protein
VRTSAYIDSARRSRWSILAFAVAGAIVGALLVVSEFATTIHADRDHESAYRFIVTVFGGQIHQSDVTSTEDLLPRMRTWAYGLLTAFVIVGALLGGAIGWFVRRLTTR